MEIVLITDYSNTKDKKQHLRKLIKDVKQHFDVCLNSHCVIYRDAHRFISNTYSINLNNFSSQDLIYNEETVNNLYKKN